MWIEPGKPAVVLAPMEGVTDFPMRQLLTEVGGFSYCVAEFLRVSQEIPPSHTFYKHVPELKVGTKTIAGVPVQVQILGGDPEKMAQTALRACQLGAQAIDINFGCPAPTVNRHDGGASLLRCPDRIRGIVKAVREVLPPFIPVSAKLRLGWDNMDDIYLNAQRAEEGGASWITIHGRTRLQGYSPPAHWAPIGIVKKNASIPVVANGEIWDMEDFLRCREQTGCEHFMLGRGTLSNPHLALAVSRELGISEGPESETLSLQDWIALLERFTEFGLAYFDYPNAVLRRIKQWLKFADMRGEFPLFDAIKRLEKLDSLFAVLRGHALVPFDHGAVRQCYV